MFKVNSKYIFSSNSAMEEFSATYSKNREMAEKIVKAGGVTVLSVSDVGHATVIKVGDNIYGWPSALANLGLYHIKKEMFFLERKEFKYFLKIDEASNDDEFESKSIDDSNEIPHMVLTITNREEALSAIKMLKGLFPNANV